MFSERSFPQLKLIYIGRNCLLGNRKKIAKFLMRTFTYRSTFLYDSTYLQVLMPTSGENPPFRSLKWAHKNVQGKTYGLKTMQILSFLGFFTFFFCFILNFFGNLFEPISRILGISIKVCIF
jgi:hypothetical protein